MACTNPNKGFVVGRNPNGTNKMVFAPYSCKGVYKKGNDWLRDYDLGHAVGSELYVDQFIELPCGTCEECRMSYSRTWADRCMVESTYHKHNYFITLTYNNEHLVLHEGWNDRTGEKTFTPTLVKNHVQEFVRSIRDHFNYRLKHESDPAKLEFLSDFKDFKYFLCGEYGSEGHRPHYHLICFGLPLDDLYEWSRSEIGDIYYRSPTIEKFWSYGNSLVGEVTYESCAYTARYSLKKQRGKESMVYSARNIVPEFTLMSRRPGIARQWYEDNRDELYSLAYMNIATTSGGKKIYASRYFDKLFQLDNPERFEEIKEDRLFFGLNKEKGVSQQTSRDKYDRLQSEAIAKHRRYMALKRRLD